LGTGPYASSTSRAKEKVLQSRRIAATIARCPPLDVQTVAHLRTYFAQKDRKYSIFAVSVRRFFQ
jgi:hypothetical protein